MSSLSLYDDFDQLERRGEEETDGLFSPFTFLVISLVLTLFGLLMLYSASFNFAINNSMKHYHFLFLQLIGLLAGFALGFVLRIIPLDALKKAHYPFSVISVLLIVTYFIKGESTPFITIRGYEIIHIPSFLILSAILSFSSVMDEIKYSDRFGLLYALSILYQIAIALSCGYIGGIGYFIVYALCIVSMIVPLGFSKSYAFLAFLFSIVLALILIFAIPAVFDSVTSSILPVSDSAYYNNTLYSSLEAIKDGSLFGLGIGNGIFKLMNYEECTTTLVFTTVIEELGLLGAIGILFLLLLYYVLALRTMKRALGRDSFIASSSFALALSVLIPFVLSILSSLGLFPLCGIYMPFFSSSISVEAVTIATTYIIYKEVFVMGRRRDDDEIK